MTYTNLWILTPSGRYRIGDSAPNHSDGLNAKTMNFDFDSLAYGLPVVITVGGTYTFNRQSLNRHIPVVEIATSQPVRLEGCNLRGAGALVASSVPGTNVTITNSRFKGTHPIAPNVNIGRAIHLNQGISLSVTNCDFYDHGGIYFQAVYTSGCTVVVERCRSKNVNGRKSTLGSGWAAIDQDGNTEYFHRYQFVQVSHARSMKTLNIRWNDIYNSPNESRVEDNINLYMVYMQSLGKPYGEVSYNLVDGAYPINPLAPRINTSTQYSGGGLLISDLSPTEPTSEYPRQIRAEGNRIVRCVNYSVAGVAGYDQYIEDNTAYYSGYLEGTEDVAASGASGDTGLLVWNAWNRTPYGDINTNNNTIGVVRGDGGVGDAWLPASNDLPNTHTNNNLLGSTDREVVRALEDAQRALWEADVANMNLTIGVVE